MVRKLSGAARPPNSFDPAGELLVDFAGQHPLDDLQRGVVGIAAALDETGLQPGLVHGPADGRPAAVDHHRPHADRLHEDDVEQQVPHGPLVLHDAAAELDHRDLAAELANPARGLRSARRPSAWLLPTASSRGRRKMGKQAFPVSKLRAGKTPHCSLARGNVNVAGPLRRPKFPRKPPGHPLEHPARSWQDWNMHTTTAVVLAAGKGTRMKSELPKVLVPVCGRPMIHYVLDALTAGGVGRIVTVVGYRADLVLRCHRWPARRRVRPANRTARHGPCRDGMPRAAGRP